MRLVAIALLVAVPARADPCVSSRRIEAGSVAPCSGVLVPLDRLEAATRCLATDLPTCRNDAAAAAAVAQARDDAAQARLAAAAGLAAHRGEALEQCLARPVVIRAPEPRWYESGPFLVVAGVAAGAIAGIITGVKISR